MKFIDSYFLICPSDAKLVACFYGFMSGQVDFHLFSKDECHYQKDQLAWLGCVWQDRLYARREIPEKPYSFSFTWPEATSS